MAKTTWDAEVEGWRDRAEAEAAAAKANKKDANAEAVVLGLHSEGGAATWDEDLEGATAFSVCDGSGSFQLFPKSADDGELDIADDIPAPRGFVWVYVA